MNIRGHRDPRVIPFPMSRVNRTQISEARKRGDVVEFICPRTRELRQVGADVVVWSVLQDPNRW